MAKIIECDDGFIARGETDEELLDAAFEHIRTSHPQVLASTTREQLLAIAVEV